MFSFRKKRNSERDAFQKEFEHVIVTMRRAPEAAQVSLSHTLNMVNTMFLQRFGNKENFIKSERSDQENYVRQLTDMEERLQTVDAPASLGVGLFKMWVGTLLAHDDALQNRFSKELKAISKKCPCCRA
jgi:hypothetical protein